MNKFLSVLLSDSTLEQWMKCQTKKIVYNVDKILAHFPAFKPLQELSYNHSAAN